MISPTAFVAMLGDKRWHDVAGWARTSGRDLLILESWVRIPPGPPGFQIRIYQAGVTGLGVVLAIELRLLRYGAVDGEAMICALRPAC